VTVGWIRCHDVMVEGVDHLRLLLTSKLDVYLFIGEYSIYSVFAQQNTT
jgi:hypothetical protein